MMLSFSVRSQDLSEAKKKTFRDRFIAEVAKAVVPPEVLPFKAGYETMIVGKDSEKGLALILCGSDVGLYSVKEEKFISFWTMGNKRPNATKLAGNSRHYAMSPGGRRIAQNTDDGFGVYDRQKHLAFVPGMFALDFINDDELLVRSNEDLKKFFTWSITQNKVIAKLPGNAWAYLSPDRKKIAISKSNKTNIYDIASGKVTTKLPGANAKWFTNNVVISGEYPPKFIDVDKKVDVVFNGIYALQVDERFLGKDILMYFKEPDYIQFYDVGKQQILNNEPMFKPGVGSTEYMVFADPPGLLVVSHDDGPQGVYVLADKKASSSAFTLYADGKMKPLFLHQPYTAEEKVAAKKRTDDYFTNAAAEAKAAKDAAMRRALAKYSSKACAEKYAVLEERGIDSGVVVSYKGDPYFFRRADCISEQIYLYKVGHQKSWGLSTFKLPASYATDIYKSNERMEVCDNCDGSGTLTFNSGKVYKQELPSFYKPGYKVTRYYESDAKSYQMCNKCKGTGVRNK